MVTIVITSEQIEISIYVYLYMNNQSHHNHLLKPLHDLPGTLFANLCYYFMYI